MDKACSFGLSNLSPASGKESRPRCTSSCTYLLNDAKCFHHGKDSIGIREGFPDSLSEQNLRTRREMICKS